MRRALAVLLAPLPLLAVPLLAAPLPAAAQQAVECPYLLGTHPEPEAGVPFEIAFGDERPPQTEADSWTLTRLAPGPVEVVGTAGRGAGARFTVTVTERTTFRVEAHGPAGCTGGDPDAELTVTPRAASPRPTVTPHADCGDPWVEGSVSAPVVDVGGTVTVRVSNTGATSWELRRLVPGPVAVVRTTASATSTSWTVRLGESHRLVASAAPRRSCPFSQPSATFDVAVRPALSLAAARTGPRTYAFAGRVLPGRGQPVALHRVGADGRRVLTARSTVRPDGTYRFDRRFVGAGRFGFVVTTPGGSTNAPGESAVRPTLVH